MVERTFRRRSHPLGFACIGLCLSVLAGVLSPLPARSAERLTTFVGPLQLSVPVDELEAFAKDGQEGRSLRLLLSFMQPEQRSQFRQVLQAPIPQNAVALSRMVHIPMVEQVLASIGNTIQTDSGLNGFHALRGAMLLAASRNPNGWTLLNLMQEYPTRDLRINLGSLLAATRELSTVLEVQKAATDVVVQASNREAQADPKIDYAQLPDLSQPGPFTIEKTQFTFQVQATRPTLQGFSGSYSLVVDLYTPAGAPGPVPVAVYSHGWGGRLSDGEYIAQHLTSHGFAVAVPKHIGTSDTYRSVFLAGALGDITNPIEYLSRQTDIIFMLDELEKLMERDRAWSGRLNLQQVGVIGQSLGGQTVLSSSGATFNPGTYRHLCQNGLTQFNPSFLLQCQSRFLPPTAFNFSDPRIRAGIAQYPMGSTMYGPEGIAKIDIPLLMLAGSQDVLAPSVYEQIPMFSWLTTPHRYLAFLVPGNHFSTSPEANIPMIPPVLRGPDAAIGRRYIKSLTVAFLKTYLSDSPETSPYRPYLTASYAQAIRQQEMALYLVTSLPPEQLAAAYGGTPPGRDRAPIPTVAARPESILDDIRQSRLVRIGIRADAPPFGYISSEGEWTGYCFAMGNALSNYLTALVDQPIKTVFLPSTVGDRFDLVRNDTVHLECGPNTIRTDVADIQFSEPFFATGSQLLVQPQNADRFNPNSSLAGVKIGVLSNTTTEQLVRNRYPGAAIVPLEGAGASRTAIRSVAEGSLDAFASDGILLTGELLQHNLPMTDFRLVPERPLTCDFYGLILPQDDPEWVRAVNTFQRSGPARSLRQEWFNEVSPTALSTLSLCEQ